MAWADYVLPEATSLERYDELSTVSHKTPFIAMREPAIAPLYDTKPGWWIARELGLRVGLESFFKWETIEEYLDTRLMSIGSSLDKMRAQQGVIIQKGKPYLEDFKDASPFGTKSGKIELYSSELGLAGHDPMPVYTAVEEPPAGLFPAALWPPSRPYLRQDAEHTLAQRVVSRERSLGERRVVAAQGFQDGQSVWLENQDGARSGPVKIKATQRIRPDAVFMAHGFGQQAPGLTRANGKGASDTQLQTRYVLDPISGGAGMRVNFVRMVKEA